MKPKTKIQKEVFALSKRLPEINEIQTKYAFRHCFEHVGRRSAKGIVTCTECGHQWQGNGHWQTRFAVAPALIAEWN